MADDTRVAFPRLSALRAARERGEAPPADSPPSAFPRLAAIRAAGRGPQQNTSTLQDLGTDVKRGFQSIPSAATGLADIPLNLLGGNNYVSRGADYLGDLTGFDPDGFAKQAESEYSEARQEDIQAFGEAEGFTESASHLLRNPGHLLGTVAESLPSMLAGGAIGKGLSLAAKMSGVVAAGAGEGAISAGQQMSGLQEQGADPQAAALASLATGITVGAVGAGGGTLAQKMGLLDPDLLVAGVARSVGDKGMSLAKRASLGAGREAGEEGIQSAAEAVLANAALDKPLGEDVGKSVAAGALAGGVLGGVTNLGGGKQEAQVAEEVPAEPAEPVVPYSEEVQAIADAATGPATNRMFSDKLRDRLLSSTTREEADESIKRKSKEIQESIRATRFYNDLPTSAESKADEEARADEVAQEESAVADENANPDIDEALLEELDAENAAAVQAFVATGVLDDELKDTKDGTLVRKVQAERDAEAAAKKAGATFDSAEEPTSGRTSAEQLPSLLRTAMQKARIDSDGVPQKEAMSKEGALSLYGLISGQTERTEDAATINAYNAAVRDVKTAKTEFREGLSNVIGKNGTANAEIRVRRSVVKNGKHKHYTYVLEPIDPKLKAFLEGITKMPDNVRIKESVRIAITNTARKLSIKHKLPQLRKLTSSIVGSTGAVQRAYAPGVVTNHVKRTRKNMEDPFDKSNAADPKTMYNLFDTLSTLTGKYDTIRGHLGKRTEGRLTKKGTLTSSAIDTSPDMEITRIADIEAIRNKKGPTKAESARVAKYDADVEHSIAMANIAAKGGAGTNVEGLYQITDEIDAQLRKIELRFGQKNVLRAMELGKEELSKTTKANQSKAGKDTSPAVRFSTLYRDYRAGGVNFGIETAAIRHTKTQQKSHRETYKAKDFTPEAVRFTSDGANVERKAGQLATRIEEIIEEKSQERAFADTAKALGVDLSKGTEKMKARARSRVAKELDKNPRYYPPMQMLLESLSGRMSPTTTLMARHLRGIIQQSAKAMQLARSGSTDLRVLEFDDYIDSIDLVVHPEASRPAVGSKGRAAGMFETVNEETGRPTIHLWQNGANPRTIIHEMLHAVTAGILASPNTQTDNQRALVADLEALMGDVVSTLPAEQEKLSAMSADMQAARAKAKKQGTKLHRTPADKQLMRDQQRLVQILTILKGNGGVDEFVSYGMTEVGFSTWMNERSAPAGFVGSKPAKQGQSWWQVFAHKIKLLIGGGVAAIKDNVFSEFIDATSGLLGEVYRASDVGNDVFSFQQGPATLDAAADFGNWKGQYAPEEGKASSGDYSQGQRDVDRNIAAIRKNTNDKKLEAAKTDQNLRAAEERTRKKGETAVGHRKNSADITFVDKLERMMLDGMTNFGTGGRYTSYELWAKERLLDRSGNAINTALENKSDRWLVTMVGKLLSKTVDQLGTPIGFRNIMHSFEANSGGALNAAYAAYEATASFSDDIQVGIIDYIYDRDEAQLTAMINDEAKSRTVLNVVKELDDLLATAKRLNRVHPNHLDDSLADFLDLAKGGSFVLKTSANIGAIKPVSISKNRVQVAGVSSLRLIGRDGVEIEGDRWKGKKFNRGTNTPEGHDVFIESGADVSVWDISRATFIPGDTRPYRVNSAANSNGEFTLSRQKTPKEHNSEQQTLFSASTNTSSSKDRAVVMSALTELMQDWAHSIEGYNATKSLLDMQDGLLEEDGTDNRFILDNTPENKAALMEEIPASRRLDFTERDEATSREAQNLLRLPGSWVLLPDNTETEALMGDMRGKYVSGPVYMAMRDFYDKEPIIKSESFRAAMATWKVNKTALSTTAHVNNVLGNVTLAYYHDIPPANIAKASKVVLRAMFKPESLELPQFAEEKALWQEMQNMGVTLAAIKTADFDLESTKSISQYLEDKASSNRGLLAVYTAMETVLSKSLDAYSNQDNIFRLALYMTTIQNDVGFQQTNEATVELKQEAARIATQGFVDYRIHAPWVRAARGTVLPFVAWPYRMVPLMFKLMITKPWKAANTIATISAVNAAAYAFLGAGEDDEEYERSVQPEWYQKGVSWLPGVPSNIRMPFGSPREDATFLSLSRSIPLADITDFSGSGLPALLSIGGPAGILASVSFNYDPFRGEEITNGTEDVAGWLQKNAEFLAKGIAPGAITNAMRFDTKMDEVGPLGEEYNFWVEASRALGISMFQMNIPEAAYSKDLSRQAVERSFKMEMGKRWRHELRQKDPDFDSALDDRSAFQERMMQHMQELNGEFGGE